MDSSPSNRENNNPFELKSLILIIKERYKLIFGVFVIGVLLAFILNYFSTPYYKSSFAVKINVTSTEQTILILNGINSMINNNRIEGLSKAMNIDPVIAGKIKHIEINQPQGEKLLEISMIVYDPNIIPEVKEGILRYLVNNNFVKQQKEIEEKKLRVVLDKIIIETKDLEEVKKVIIKSMEVQSDAFSKIQIFSPYNIHFKLVDLKKKESDILKALDLLESFRIINEPIIPRNPSGPNNSKRSVVICVLSIVFGVFLAIFLESL